MDGTGTTDRQPSGARSKAGWLCAGGLTKRPDPVRPPKPKPRPQDVAAKELAHAQGKVDEHLANLLRSARLVKEWQARASRYAKKAAMTDDEVAAAARLHMDRKTRRAKSVRGIQL